MPADHVARRGRVAGAIGAALVTGVLAAEPVRAATVEVTAASLAFTPADVTVQLTGNEPGSPAPHAHVVWTMTDAATQHTVTFDDPRLVSSAPLGGGQKHEALIYLPGSYTYRCTIHPSMKGTVVVTPEAATAAPGSPTTSAPPASSAPAPTPARADGDGDGDGGGGAGTGVVAGIGAAGLAGAAGVGWLLTRRRSPSGPAGG